MLNLIIIRTVLRQNIFLLESKKTLKNYNHFICGDESQKLCPYRIRIFFIFLHERINAIFCVFVVCIYWLELNPAVIWLWIKSELKKNMKYTKNVTRINSNTWFFCRTISILMKFWFNPKIINDKSVRSEPTLTYTYRLSTIYKQTLVYVVAFRKL